MQQFWEVARMREILVYVRIFRAALGIATSPLQERFRVRLAADMHEYNSIPFRRYRQGSAHNHPDNAETRKDIDGQLARQAR
eukprot:scaffold24560_cov150-Skeletonema_dohrnii-CCMP3373.AAC.1